MRTRTARFLLALAAVAGVNLPASGQEEATLSGDTWVESGSSVLDPDLARARELLARDEPAEAKAILTPWIRAHEYSDHPELPEAYLLRGDAKLMAGDEYEALYDYEAIAKRFYGTPAFPRAIERESEIATRYIHGLRRKWMGWLRLEGARSLGEELLIRVQERMPGSQLAETAALELADYYYKRRDLPMAADMYGIIAESYPESPYRRYAALREIYANIAGYKGPRYDRSALVETGILIEDFQARYPADAEQAGVTAELTAWVDESAATHLLDTAKWYLRRGDEASARFTLRRLVRDNPRSAAAAEAVRVMTEHGWVEAPVEAVPAEPEPGDTGSGETGSGETGDETP
jgi:outer membrane protein assembly factor BamD (BamD/ComL family)